MLWLCHKPPYAWACILLIKSIKSRMVLCKSGDKAISQARIEVFTQADTSTAQGAEAWKALGGWISEAKPQFGPGIKERFQAASKLQPGQVHPPSLPRIRHRSQSQKVVIRQRQSMQPTDAGSHPQVGIHAVLVQPCPKHFFCFVVEAVSRPVGDV